MIWPFKKKRECLMCGYEGEHTTEIHYNHQSGADVAYLCDDCANDIQENSLEIGDDESL